MLIGNIALKGKHTLGRAKMYNRLRIWFVQTAVNGVIPRQIRIAPTEDQHATIARNPAIGPLSAALLKENPKVATRAPIGLLNHALKEPSGPFLWGHLL